MLRCAPPLIAIIAVALSGAASPADAAPTARQARTARPAQQARNTADTKPRVRVKAGWQAKTVRMPRQRTNTVVRQWKTGTGEGHNLVFLHGLGGVPEGPMANGIVRRLDERGVNATISAPILREVEIEGGQIVRENTQTMTEQLKHARSVIDAQPGKVVLFGHSFGAKAALKLAREYPEKVSGVIVIAPSVKMLYSYWKRLTGERGLGTPEQMREMFGGYEDRLRTRIQQEEDPEMRLQLKEGLKYHKVMTDLIGHNEGAIEGQLPVPTLVMHGVKDDAVSVHYVKRFAEGKQNLKLVTYDGRDHHLMGKNANESRQTLDDVAARIDRFLATHD